MPRPHGHVKRFLAGLAAEVQSIGIVTGNEAREEVSTKIIKLAEEPRNR